MPWLPPLFLTTPTPQPLRQRPLSTPFPTVETFLSSCQKRKLPPGMHCIPQLPWQWPAAVLGSGLALHQRLGIHNSEAPRLLPPSPASHRPSGFQGTAHGST